MTNNICIKATAKYDAFGDFEKYEVTASGATAITNLYGPLFYMSFNDNGKLFLIDDYGMIDPETAGERTFQNEEQFMDWTVEHVADCIRQSINKLYDAEAFLTVTEIDFDIDSLVYDQFSPDFEYIASL